jgi:hypothetical protein
MVIVLLSRPLWRSIGHVMSGYLVLLSGPSLDRLIISVQKCNFLGISILHSAFANHGIQPQCWFSLTLYYWAGLSGGVFGHVKALSCLPDIRTCFIPDILLWSVRIRQIRLWPRFQGTRPTTPRLYTTVWHTDAPRMSSDHGLLSGPSVDRSKLSVQKYHFPGEFSLNSAFSNHGVQPSMLVLVNIVLLSWPLWRSIGHVKAFSCLPDSRTRVLYQYILIMEYMYAYTTNSTLTQIPGYQADNA